MPASQYINYKRFSVRYDLEGNTFSVFYDGMGEVIKDARIVSVVSKREPQLWPEGYGKAISSVRHSFDSVGMSVNYSGSEIGRQDAGLDFQLSDSGLRIFVNGEGSAPMQVEGLLNWGAHCQRETMAVNLDNPGAALRSAFGPAAGAGDTALFDRDTDSAIKFKTSGKFKFEYDWDAEAYKFSYNSIGQDYARALIINVENHVYERRFTLDYKKVNPNSTFKTPPVGWMTWYSVQFDAGEKTVLENAEWQEKYLKDYGADTVWVDWEWYHKDFSSEGPKDIDMFHPNPAQYPHGLKYVAEKIKELGFIPALWIGPTCDPTKNEMLEKYPDSLMIRKPMWSGQYFFDPTNPDYINEILPKMVKQAPDWGYEAIKWDVLPNTTVLCDECRDTRYNPAASSREAMIGIFKKAREVLGKDYYMLYCAGSTKRDMDLACSVFDAARIGGDIFRWEEFISQCVDRVFAYYMLHTVVCNNDPDNVIIREKFNTYDQAITRAALVSLLGLPFTLGDNLPDLPDDRVEILRRSIPPVPAHPMDIRSGVSDHNTVVINLAVEKPFMRYNVADIINLREDSSTATVSLRGDLNLDADKSYYVYDYWNREFLGAVKDSFSVDLRPFASRIFVVRPVEDKPQLISTSRHISQGAIDVLDVKYDAEDMRLYGRSDVVGGEPYEIVVCAPESLRVFGESDKTTTNEHSYISGTAWRCVFHPETTGEFEWSIGFTPTTKR